MWVASQQRILSWLNSTQIPLHTHVHLLYEIRFFQSSSVHHSFSPSSLICKVKQQLSPLLFHTVVRFLGSIYLCPFVVRISHVIFSLLICVQLDYLHNISSLARKILFIPFLHRTKKPRYKVLGLLPGLPVEKFRSVILECI